MRLHSLTFAFYGAEQKDLELIEQKVLVFSGNKAIDIIFTGEYQHLAILLHRNIRVNVNIFLF
ncbi:hypothetical protein ACFSTH_12905 [Paenibacillus yanchengensis]